MELKHMLPKDNKRQRQERKLVKESERRIPKRFDIFRNTPEQENCIPNSQTWW